MSNQLRLLFWELTSRCNLQCCHCRAAAQPDASPDELSTAEILHLVRSIRKDADPIIVLTGGEPLTRPDFFTIAAACTEQFSHVALATNGTLIDDAVAQQIRACDIERVSISLDGARPETHESFRGVEGSFTAALRGMAALQHAGVSLQINATLTKHNSCEIDRLLELALSWHVDAFHLFCLVPVGCGASISQDQRLSSQETEDILKWLFLRSVELHGRLQFKATCAPQYFRVRQELAAKHGIPLPAQEHGMHAMTRGCLAGSSVCFLSHHGDVQPCGYLPVRAGNVRQQSLGEIWATSEVFAKLRDVDRLTGKCRACEFRTDCQGCRARAYASSGDYLATDPDCPHHPSGTSIVP